MYLIYTLLLTHYISVPIYITHLFQNIIVCIYKKRNDIFGVKSEME